MNTVVVRTLSEILDSAPQREVFESLPLFSHNRTFRSSRRNVHLEIRQSMSTLMDMMNATKVTMAWEMHQQGVPKTHIAQRLGKYRETIHLWIKGVEREGLMPFLDG